MISFRWTEAKSVFVPELDAEHRNVHDLAREVHTAIISGVPAARFMPKLRCLLAAAEDHFSHEEQLMKAARYSLIKWHTRQHDTVRRRAAVCLQRIEARDSQAAEELLGFLSVWLNAHMAVADRMMAAVLRAKSWSSAA
jgi:hemerythrin